MADFFDQVARILATPMPRRRAFRLFGAAFAAAMVGTNVVSADSGNCKAPQKACGNGANGKCCPANTCCAAKGIMTSCCSVGQCTTEDGTCVMSQQNQCPKGTKLCS